MSRRPNFVRIARRFHAPPERVFDAWGDPALTSRWLFTSPTSERHSTELDFRVGGAWTITDRRECVDYLARGEYVEIDRPRRLVFTFEMPQFAPGVFDRVIVEIEPDGDGCVLTITQEGVYDGFEGGTIEGWAKMLDGLAIQLRPAPAPYAPTEGAPCWLDLRTSDPKKAKEFYGALLGWTYLDSPDAGPFSLCRSQDQGVAAIGPQFPGGPSGWTVYLATKDADATVKAAVQRGGSTVIDAGDVGDLGRLALVRDPGGAVVGLWQAGVHAGFKSLGGHGGPVWFEVNTRQGEAVRDFFAALFDLSPEPVPGMQYWTMVAQGQQRYGVLQMLPEWEGIEPNWMTYFQVTDVNAALDHVTYGGGKVLNGPFDTPFGRVAVCQDPLGAAFSLMTPR